MTQHFDKGTSQTRNDEQPRPVTERIAVHALADQQRDSAGDGLVDIFVSYAREDQRFVRRFQEALVANGQRVWVDWECIPPTVEWLSQIERAIESSAVFVFVLSPDSISSEVCRRELDHAVAHGKRIVPVVFRDPSAETVPDSVGRLNWVFLRDEDSFDDGIEIVLKAVATDYDWVRFHTRLLVRATEWARNHHDKSFVLKGKDLGEAENTCDNASGKSPRLLDLQRQYLTASRQGATAALLKIIVGTAVALVVATGAAIVAYMQYQLAETRFRMAQSRQLASSSQLQIDQNLPLSMLLAALSSKVDDTLESRQVLADLTETAKRIREVDREAAAGPVRFSGDGSRLTWARRDGSVIVSTLRSPDLEIVFRPDLGPMTPMAIDHEGRRVVVGLDGIGLVILDTAAPSEAKIIEFDARPRHVSLSSDGARLAVSGEDHRIYLWDLHLPGIVAETLVNDASMTCMKDLSRDACVHQEQLVFSEDSRFLTWICPRQFVRWDVARRAVESSEKVSGLGLGPDWEGQGEISLAKSICTVAYDPTHDRVAVGRHDGSVSLYQLGAYSLIGHLENSANVREVSMTFARDGRRLLTHSSRTLIVWDVERRFPVLRYGFPTLVEMAIAPDGERVAMVLDDPLRLVLLDVAERPSVEAVSKETAPDSALAVVAGFGRARVRGDSGAYAAEDIARRRAPDEDCPAQSGVDVDKLEACRRDRLEMWDLRTGKLLQVFELRRVDEAAMHVSSAEIAPAGDVMLVGYQGGWVDLFHVPTGGLIARKRLRDWVYGHYYSEPDGAFHIWDPYGGSLVWTVDRSTSYNILCAAAGRDLAPDAWKRFVGGSDYIPICTTPAVDLQ